MKSPIRVLLVEDHPGARLSLALALRRHGYEVIEAETVSEAIAAGHSAPFDILLCDIELPDGFGWDVLNELRATGDFLAISVTGHSSPEEVEKQFAMGFDTTIGKPFSFPTLHGLMRLMMESRGG